jgi:hypothetical protein
MAPLPSVPDVIKCELLFTQDGAPAANILHVAYSGGPPAAADLISFAGTLGSNIWSAVRADYPTTTEFVACRCTDLATDTGAVGTSSFAEFGTAEDPATPANCCVLTVWQISRRYRGGHPRTYWLPFANGQVVDGREWMADGLSDLNGGITTFQDSCTTLTSGSTTLAGQVNVSYRSADAPRVDPVVDPVTGFSTTSLIRTQRRRITSSSY